MDDFSTPGFAVSIEYRAHMISANESSVEPYKILSKAS